MENAYVFEAQNLKFEELTFRFCGISECLPEHSCGPYIRQTYILHYILSGKGLYRVKGRQRELGKGEGFLIEPGVPVYYKADVKKPWSYLWVAFSGKKASECMCDLGLGGKHLTFVCGCSDELKKTVLMMLDSSKISMMTQQYVLQGLLYRFLAIMMRDIEPGGILEAVEKNLYVERAIQYICNHYARAIRVTDIADCVCIDRSYLYKLSKKTLGVSPQEFLIRFRIFRAIELLTLTEQSVEAVAGACGYKNAFIFSTIFKKKIGVSPGNYRRQERKSKQKKIFDKREELYRILRTGNIYIDFEHKNI